MATALHHVLITGPPGVGKTTLVRKVCAILTEHQVAVRGFYTEEVRGHYYGASGGRVPRVGFDVVTMDGKRAPLARVQCGECGSSDKASSFKVGKYAVDVQSFESLALPSLETTVSQNMLVVSGGGEGEIGGRGGGEGGGGCGGGRGIVLVIDEVGKMELFSRLFVDRVDFLFTAMTQGRKIPSSKSSVSVGDSDVPEGVLLLGTIPVARPHQKMHWLVQKLKQRDDCILFQVTEKNRDRLEEDIVAFILQRI